MPSKWGIVGGGEDELAVVISNNEHEDSAHQTLPALMQPISKESIASLIEYFRRGAKPAAEWRCGIEFELPGYDARRFERIDAAQVQIVLAGFASSSSDLVFEGRTLVEASAGLQPGRVTVEPGGQVEFSGAPERSLIDVERGMNGYLSRLRELAELHNFAFLAIGFDPIRTIQEQHWFPKMRYEVMRPYLASRGNRAWDMMCRTSAVQVNLDYGSEEDLVKKFVLGNRIAPIITAIFANSPFADGKPSGYKSTRAAAWLETDNDRALIALPTLTDDFSLAAFVDYALNVPMLFAQRNGHYLSTPTGMRFGDFLERGCGEIQPVFGDWADHLTTIFTDARLKQHIELRSADGARLDMSLALAALWKGLMYDARALDEALRLAPRLNWEDASTLRECVARDALTAQYAGVSVLGMAKEVVALAVAGLRNVAPDELRYLDILCAQVIDDEVCPADILLLNWHGSWHGSMSQVIDYSRIA